MALAQHRERIVPRLIEEEMRESFLDYSMSVIVQRALPDVRDGLKPVHRRILYSMYELGLSPERPYKKSAAVVGDVLGKYHPHGDAAVYETLVRMVQDFSLRYPLVDGQGNFGSIDGDNAAAYRYTEARLGAAALELLADIDKETVAFAPNFDGRLAEPAVLPARLPNLLVNGSSGIAVGMSTNVPPHNVTEVAAVLRYLIEHPSCTIADLTKRLPGPDFPTGGVIVGSGGVREMYETGRGRLIVRARIVKELLRNGKEQLVVTEMPYMVSKTRVIEQIAELVREKRLEGVADLRDESDRDGIRVVIELKRGAEAEKIVARLYRHTHLQSTFGAIVLALDHGQPREFNLKQLLERWRDHRVDVVQRRSRFELERAVAERHLTEGILVAVDAIEEVVRLIRGSKDREQAAARLRKRFKLSEAQADAILSMRFARLTGLERSELKERLRTLTREIARLEAILASERKQLQVVLAELAELVERFGDERRTEILADDEDIALEDAVASEDVVIALSHQGYVKRSRARAGRTSASRGKGEEAGDYTERAFTARTTDRLLFFGEHGQVYSLPVLEVPEAGPASRGQLLHRLLGVRRAERIVGLTAVGESAPEQTVLFVTVAGMTKRTPLREVATTRAGGILAMRLQSNDRVLDARVVDGSEDIVLVTRRGRAIRFAAGDVSVMGRGAAGVRGMRLQAGDQLVGVAVARRDATILTMTALGLGKQSPVSDYPLQHRGGQGTQAVRDSEGAVVAAFEVVGEGELMIVTASGEARPVGLREIPVRRRTKPGAKLIEATEADPVAAVTRLVERAGAAGPVATGPHEAEASETPGQLELTMSDERKR